MKPTISITVGTIVLLLCSWVLPPFLISNSHKVLAAQLILTLAVALIAAIAIWYLRLLNRSRNSSNTSGVPQILSLLQEAERKLASSALGRNARFSNLPVILVCGSESAAKTTIVMRSGLEPELLAGRVSADGSIAPTGVGNVWLSQHALFLEIGATVAADPKTWQTLARHLQPAALSSALKRSVGSPRAVVVCYECENLLKPGAADSAVTAAKAIRAQLGQLSAELGVNLPVYVLFTKLDRIGFFLDFVKHLERQEAAQILGATLPVENYTTGAYGERESARLGEALSELSISLSNIRTELLARESDPESTLAAYEFPREFRKMRSAAVAFLLELCRPSQLASGPFLRGFYFTGVRPVILNQEVASDFEPAVQAQYPSNPDATSIFSHQRAAVQPLARGGVSRGIRSRVPEWVFLSGFFQHVVLSDRSGLASSAASTHVSFSRRLLLGSIAALCLLFGIASLVSFVENFELISNVRRAAASVASDNTSPQTMSLESLSKLDSLRALLIQLIAYDRAHPPLSLRWGLYTGSEILPDARRIYFSRFKTLFFDPLHAGLLGAMRGWPPAPTPQSNYGYNYSTLKAYLEITSNHEKATLQFLPALLQERWVGDQPVDSRRVALARRQFDFYATELAAANPYDVPADAATVAKARAFLIQSGSSARTYQAMLTEADRQNRSIVFNKYFPGSAEAVINTFDIPGAFTKPGFAFMETAIKNPAQYATGEKWVLGDKGAGAGDDTGNLPQQIEALYDRDYIATWRDYLRKSSVVRYGSLSDASRKLTLISSPQSPLLALFFLASQNTDVAAPSVQKAFKPLHTLIPPGSADQYVGPSNTLYMNALTTLQSSIDQAAKLPPDQVQTAADQTTTAAASATLAARQTALTLGLDPDAHIEAVISKLMTDPITHLDAVKPNGANPAPLNGAGAEFCSKYRTVLAKYPFDLSSKSKATIEDLNSVFRPQSGLLWQFYEGKLSKLLVKQSPPMCRPQVRSRKSRPASPPSSIEPRSFRTRSMPMAPHKTRN